MVAIENVGFGRMRRRMPVAAELGLVGGFGFVVSSATQTALAAFRKRHLGVPSPSPADTTNPAYYNAISWAAGPEWAKKTGSPATEITRRLAGNLPPALSVSPSSAAVRRAQEKLGITRDSFLGPNTAKALDAVASGWRTSKDAWSDEWIDALRPAPMPPGPVIDTVGPAPGPTPPGPLPPGPVPSPIQAGLIFGMKPATLAIVGVGVLAVGFFALRPTKGGA